MELAGELALVTGAGIRLGRALALGLAGAGARLALHYHRHGPQAEELAAEINAGHSGAPRARCFAADLGSPASSLFLAREVEEAMGPVSLLVLSAAIYPPEPLAAITPESFEATLRTNLTSPFFLAHTLGLRMKARGRGAIVALLDWSLDRPYANHIPYTIAKAGLRAAVLGLARALAPEVRCNGLAPGAVLLPEGIDPALEAAIVRATPLKRIGSPADAVEGALYLLGAEFVTGTILTVDGGRTVA